MGQKGGGPSRAAADIQNGVLLFELQQLHHESDGVGLGDRLSSADGEGIVLIGQLLQIIRDKVPAVDLIETLNEQR